MIKKWILRIIGSIIALALIAGVVFYVLIIFGAFGPMPSKHSLERITQQTASLVKDNEGHIIGKYFVQNRTNIDIDSLPDYIKQTLVATEDERFYNHAGVDYRSMGRVFLKTILFQKDGGGGSTITQQLAKNLFGRQSFGKLTIPVNKTKEIILAKRLEDVYEKDKIIEIYLNLVPFGENVFGIESAAQRYFNKHAQNLKIEEAAVLIGMLKANTTYNPRLNPEKSKARRNVVFGQLLRNEFIDQTEYDALLLKPLIIDYANKETIGIADYFLNQVKAEANFILKKHNRFHIGELNLETDGLVIETTLDRQLQQLAINGMEKHLKQMQKLLTKQYKSGKSKQEVLAMAKTFLQENGDPNRISNKTKYTAFNWDKIKLKEGTVLDSLIYHYTKLQAGILAIDPNTGAIKTYVGGIDFRTQPFDQIQARRQMASAFKPLLYAAGLEDGTKPCDYLSNEPVVLEDFEDWSPENYDKTNQGGRYSMAAALSKSLNLPALHLYFQVGHNKLNRLWNDFDFKGTLPNNPSAALGTAEANMVEMARLYSAFANGGNRIEAYYINRILDKEGTVIYEHEPEKPSRIMSEENATLMRQMLERTVKTGTAVSIKSRFGVRREIAGKTGTGQNYADAWFCSFTPDLVMISRVGCSSPSIHFNNGAYGSGSALALPLIGYFAQGIQKDQSLSAKYFNDFSHETDVDLTCIDYKKAGIIDQVFNLFGKDKTTLEKERKKAEVKQGIRKGVREIFGK
ncbi:MAG: penicillin-binding protein [Salibacteraceae bacterium]|nr:penicillin-binding protein [Salibacteraceae bacterium]